MMLYKAFRLVWFLGIALPSAVLVILLRLTGQIKLLVPPADPYFPVFEFYMPTKSRLRKLLGRRFNAVAVGGAIIFIESMKRGTAEHEYTHQRQMYAWGILMPAAYIVASILAVLKGKHFYRDNCFEVEAQQAAKDVARRT